MTILSVRQAKEIVQKGEAELLRLESELSVLRHESKPGPSGTVMYTTLTSCVHRIRELGVLIERAKQNIENEKDVTSNSEEILNFARNYDISFVGMTDLLTEN